ncbi:hypothetical protein HanOQP8_Chr02g0045641 [Helianthus annuus]|nr:hypothetical protein HanOQP8_Chr02g0045641 [Helianthus annuus]
MLNGFIANLNPCKGANALQSLPKMLTLLIEMAECIISICGRNQSDWENLASWIMNHNCRWWDWIWCMMKASQNQQLPNGQI